MSPQLLLARFANEVYDAVGKDRYFGNEPLSREEWAKVDLAWKRILVDMKEESDGNTNSQREQPTRAA